MKVAVITVQEEATMAFTFARSTDRVGKPVSDDGSDAYPFVVESLRLSAQILSLGRVGRFSNADSGTWNIKEHHCINR